jgi:hypothetical protein
MGAGRTECASCTSGIKRKTAMPGDDVEFARDYLVAPLEESTAHS